MQSIKLPDNIPSLSFISTLNVNDYLNFGNPYFNMSKNYTIVLYNEHPCFVHHNLIYSSLDFSYGIKLFREISNGFYFLCYLFLYISTKMNLQQALDYYHWLITKQVNKYSETMSMFDSRYSVNVTGIKLIGWNSWSKKMQYSVN